MLYRQARPIRVVTATSLYPDDTSLNSVALGVLIRLAGKRPRAGYIPFPVVFARICPMLCMKKPDAWKLLHRLNAEERITIVPFHGVRLIEGVRK